ncbi:YdcF family protein [Deinococcus sp. Arct2-2]|uniref:YdcF family protein n=1 Tax=Deinococcus sp. Arct2-2 TaxID=2568653 RepID=UPI001F0EC2F7|nr:YdcF family protein [Deinococcus sp. Arct2-2]
MGLQTRQTAIHERVRGVLSGAAIGCAFAVLAAYLGEVRAPVPLLLACILASAGLGAFRLPRRVLKVGAGALAALFALCLLTPVLRAPLASLTENAEPVQSDAVIVLGAGVWCGTGALEPSSLARLIRGLGLWQAGFAPAVTVSQQSGLIGPKDCPKLSDLEQAYIRGLYPKGGPQVLTLPNVTTTRDEAARVRELARVRGWKRVLLVTSPSHSARAARLFRAQLAPLGVSVTSVNAPETRFDTTLPLPSDRLAALRVLLYEGISRTKAGVGGTPER